MSEARYLLDTNIVSQSAKSRPAEGVQRFLRATSLPDLFISVVSLGEVEHGIERLPEGMKRAELRSWLMFTLRPLYAGRILVVDERVMSSWAVMVARSGKRPGQLPIVDSFLAATALCHGLTVVTRNTADFQLFGVPLLNPFEANP